MNARSTRLAVIAVVLVLALCTCGGCCRPATEFQMAKWEKKYKFESPRKFWGLHLFTKKKDKKIKVKY